MPIRGLRVRVAEGIEGKPARRLAVDFAREGAEVIELPPQAP
jgi:hypothetical protein